MKTIEGPGESTDKILLLTGAYKLWKEKRSAVITYIVTQSLGWNSHTKRGVSNGLSYASSAFIFASTSIDHFSHASSERFRN